MKNTVRACRFEPLVPATDEQIDDLAIRIHEPIEGEYREFLKTTNGGTPYFDSFDLPDGDGSSIDRFYSTNSPDDALSRETFADRYPPGFIPIARCEGGDLILMSTDSGAIYFWEHEFEADDGIIPDLSNMTLVATGLRDFLQNLFREELGSDGQFIEFRQAAAEADVPPYE